jgi:DNA-binding NarL/FixJ family response regulator
VEVGHRVALACRPQLLRLGLERLLEDAGFDLISHPVPFTPPVPADVAVLSERELGDLERVCGEARGMLAHELVIVFSRPTAAALLECLAAGVRGFAAEHDSPADLVRAVQAAAAGEYHLSPGTLGLLLDWHRMQRRPRHERTRARDRHLLSLLAAGATTSTIADRLGIAPKTVRNRTSLLYRRLGVRSRQEAVVVAEERGLLN